jgi:hypothetical protein
VTVHPTEEGILEVAEPLEAESEERTEPTQAEVENSVLRAFIDISYYEQQGFEE